MPRGSESEMEFKKCGWLEMNIRIHVVRRLLWSSYGLCLLLLASITVMSNQGAVKGIAGAAAVLLIISGLVCRRFIRLSVDQANLQKDAAFIRNYRLRRHDWMNDLQLIFAYVKMKKLDKLSDCVENIKKKLEQEGQLLKLGMPSIEQPLLAFSGKYPEIPIEVIVDEKILLERANQVMHDYSEVIETLMHQCDDVIMNDESADRKLLKLNINLRSSLESGLFELVIRGNFNLEPLAQLAEQLSQNNRGLTRIHDIGKDEEAVGIQVNIPDQILAG